jgi:hypothetical protein
MVFTKEMGEIVDFLVGQKEYAIFAGFATEIHTEIASSPDIDVFLSDKSRIKFFSKVFLENGWRKTRNISGGKDELFVTFEKNKTTLDLWTSKRIKEVSIPNREKVVFRKRKLYTICKEELFLEKMIGASLDGRKKYKQERDKKAVKILRKKVNPKKLTGILKVLPGEFFSDD